MSKSVIVSIRPERCAKIASGEKIIEVRKTRPNLPTPFKCYIYCTAGWIKKMPTDYLDENFEREKVIGEFVCDNVLDVCISISNPKMVKEAYPFPGTGLTDLEILNYLGNGGYGYGWHISNLKIYDSPKSLSAFHHPCTPACNFSEECGGVQDGGHCLFPMKRPPQSWCYVEELI